MKKIILLAGLLLFSGCESKYSLENAIKNAESAQTEVAIKPKVPFDCHWDFLEKYAEGNLLAQLTSTLDNAITIYDTGYSPADVLVVDNISVEEWYYNYTENNTLKVIMGGTPTIEAYYYSEVLTDMASYSREINEEIMEVFGCDGSVIDKETTSYGSDIYYVFGNKIECNLYNGLISLKYTKSEE